MFDIPLIKPYITEETKQQILDVLESGYLTEGPVTREFESHIRDYCGARHCIAVTSCTTGLELALRAVGIGPGDEVIVPDYTYPATASVVSIVGATAVIVDIDPNTMLIDYTAMETAITSKTKAAIPVSLFGNPLDWHQLNEIKKKYNIVMIEDAACALGSAYQSKNTGSLADITVFSHHPRKFITTGEGGSITTDNDAWAKWIASYKHFGVGMDDTRSTTEFIRIGTNYKLSNVLAAIGLSQMKQIEELLNERRHLANRYLTLLKNNSDIELPRITPGGRHSWQTFCVFVENRDQIMQTLRERGIEVQIGTYALHMHRAFSDNPNCRIEGDMAASRHTFEHVLALPMYHSMTEDEQTDVLKNLMEIL